MKYLFTFQREVDKTAIVVERQCVEATSEKEARELLDYDEWEHHMVAQDMEYYGGNVAGFDYAVDLFRVTPLENSFKMLKNEKYL